MTGAPGRIRTHDPQIRSLVLYPAELPVRSGPPNLVTREPIGKEGIFERTEAAAPLLAAFDAQSSPRPLRHQTAPPKLKGLGALHFGYIKVK